MSKIRNVLWGLVLITVGVVIGLNTLGYTQINIFFDGWWTLSIIVPCFIGLFKEKSKVGNIVGIFIGVMLLLAARDVIGFDMLLKLAIPVTLIIIGISFVFKDVFTKNVNKKIKELNDKLDEKTKAENVYCSVFSGQKLNFSGEVFKGASITAVFGGIDCDLRGAVIEEDIVINAEGIFGGIDIFPPSNVKVKVKSTSLFGGVSNKAIFTGDENSPTIYINATCIFGGVDIK